MRRSFKFRAYPTCPQEGRAARLLADHCDLYNAALEERREAWRMGQRSITYGMQSGQLRGIRQADPGGSGPPLVHGPAADPPPCECPYSPRSTRALKKGKAGYPRFKPYSRFDQVGIRRRCMVRSGPRHLPADGHGQRFRPLARLRSARRD